MGESSCASVASRSMRSSRISSDNLGDPGVRPVDLVDDDDDAVSELERTLKDEARLRHRSLGGVHQEYDAVDHLEDALHLAAEIGVAQACRRC